MAQPFPLTPETTFPEVTNHMIPTPTAPPKKLKAMPRDERLTMLSPSAAFSMEAL